MRQLAIAYGSNRQAKRWVNKVTSFHDLKARLKVVIYTNESTEEYATMSKEERDIAKDHGGFVAGVLIEGRRKLESVASRSMITLDADRISPNLIDNYDTPFTSILYTTHSHTPDSPRARLIFPLTRDVTSEEYVAVSRYLAQMLGIDYFDECSYQPNQLMYWPSTSHNGTFLFKEVDKTWLNPDEILSEHPEWQDSSKLPISSREIKANQVSGKKVQDPISKEGVVGVFNRAYFPISKALETFLSDIYEPTDNANRWHFKASSSMAGVEIIEDKFVYSHHAKDLAYLKLCNAFDIVRIHLFAGDFDKTAKFAMEQEAVQLLATNERLEEASREFTPLNNDDWKKMLKYRAKSTTLENSTYNLLLILENDPKLKGIVFNELWGMIEIKGELPWNVQGKYWRDADDAQLACYLDANYLPFSLRNIDCALTKVTDDRAYHPIKDYFDNLPEWDGTKRLDTLFIDYLGAEDNDYIRATCRKTLCAAYKRVYSPGIKFDNLPVFNGPQGIGKSTFIANLGMSWFSDSLALSDMNDNTAAEKLQGYWIHEIGELAGMKKADIDRVKAFISRCDDSYRASFGKRVTPHPRQCIFFGTTNSEEGYLRDITGNRRFWNISVTGICKYKPWDMTKSLIDQIWAEVKVVAPEERLYLPEELEVLAQTEQTEAMERDDREGVVARYLDLLLPENWNSMDLIQRREFVSDPSSPFNGKGTVKRMKVSNIEIWSECFCRPKEDIKPIDSYAIARIMARLSDWERSNRYLNSSIYGRQRCYVRKCEQ